MPATKKTAAADRSTEAFWAYHKRHSKDLDKKSPQAIALRNRIVLENDNLAKKVAHRWVGQCQLPYEDLLQLARIGLIKAAERFNVRTGNAFSSFAVPYIQGEILHYLRDEWNTVKVPRRSIELASKVKRIKRIMAQHGIPVKEEQIGSALGLTTEKWQWVQQAASGNLTVNIDDCHDVAAPTMDVWETTTYKPQGSWVVNALAQLDDPTRTCILEAFFAGVEIRAIAKRCNVSPQTVKTWVKVGLQKLAEKGKGCNYGAGN